MYKAKDSMKNVTILIFLHFILELFLLRRIFDIDTQDLRNLHNILKYHQHEAYFD